jgi:hypothetical protein
VARACEQCRGLRPVVHGRRRPCSRLVMRESA